MTTQLDELCEKWTNQNKAEISKTIVSKNKFNIEEIHTSENTPAKVEEYAQQQLESTIQVNTLDVESEYSSNSSIFDSQYYEPIKVGKKLEVPRDMNMFVNSF